MFDVDRMTAVAQVNLELTKQDVCFFEYRTDFNKSSCEIKAMFEIKNKRTHFVEENMKAKIGSAVWAQIQLCKKIGCRYFFVISDSFEGGKQPFSFYEYDFSFMSFKNIGVLDYDKDNKLEKVNHFWKNILKLI